MTNLIQNGLQSVDSNKQPKIEVVLKSEHDKIIISVKDNGQGINPNLQDKVFEPKFTTKTKGMGLGLGIVKNIIDSHKGKIRYQTDDKLGTVFIIELQLKKTNA